ncbi:MAG TPA: type II secretion system protein [Burkholderiales bacterium]|nr:type II secretion system protein [Burkholderiales bacterium]
MGNAKRSAQGGFTLIEVMVVAAIIGILASVLLPSARSYAARAKVSEAILALSDCRNVITDIYTSGSDIPAINSWGCEAEQPSKFVERIEVQDEGKVRLTLSNGIGDGRLALYYITLMPLNGSGNPMQEADLGTPVRRWRCGAAADGTDVKPEFLPGSCRG